MKRTMPQKVWYESFSASSVQQEAAEELALIQIIID